MTVSKKELINDLLKVKDTLGRFPSKTEYRELGKFSIKPFFTVFGSWSNAIQELGGEVSKGGGFKRGDLPVISYLNYPRINTDKIIVGCDPHIPYYDIDICNEMLDYAEREKIKDIIIAGDLLDFKELYKKETQQVDIDWMQEVEEAVNFLETLSTRFDNIYIIMGNHDHRIIRLLSSRTKAERLYSLIFRNPKLKFFKHFYALVNDWIFVVHPDTMRKSKLSLVEELADHYQKSILMAHSHRFSYGLHDSGKYVLAEGLCLTKKDYHEYASLKLNVYSQWIRGFWIVSDKLTFYVKHDRISS